jgi:hypothetical protein
MRPSPDVVWRDLEGEAVLLDLASGIYFGLNEVGTRVWQLLDEGLDHDRVVETISGEFAAERVVVDGDVRALVAELRVRGLVVEDSHADPARSEGRA